MISWSSIRGYSSASWNRCRAVSNQPASIYAASTPHSIITARSRRPVPLAKGWRMGSCRPLQWAYRRNGLLSLFQHLSAPGRPSPSHLDGWQCGLAGIAKLPCKSRQRSQAAHDITQGWFQIHTLPGEFHQIVRAPKRFVPPNQKCLQRLLNRLLAVEQAILRVGRVESKHALRTPQVLAALFHPGKGFLDADRIRLHSAAFLPAILSREGTLSNGAGCRSCGVCRSGSHRFGGDPQRPCSQCQDLSYLLARRRVKRSSDRSRYRVQRRRVPSNRRDKSALGDKRL